MRQARAAVSDSVASSNRESLGYGLGVAVGTVLAIQVMIKLDIILYVGKCSSICNMYP